MTKWFKKWFWPTVRVSLPILIVVSGIIFIVFAVIHKLIDADSARYLLSAIVQALAALLAIIFAGVAILWGQEYHDSSEFSKLRRRIADELFGPYTNKSSDVEYAFKKIVKWVGDGGFDAELSRISNKKGEEKSKAQKILFKERLLGFARIIRMGLLSFREEAEEKRRKEILKAAEKVKDIVGFSKDDLDKIEYHSGALYFRSRAWELSDLLDKGSRLFYLDYVIAINSKVDVILRKFRALVMDYNIEDLVVTFRRGRRARGSLFLTLISLYSITIAGGIVFLSILKEGVLAPHATWYAAGPLLFAICAVALTFYYLARIVSGERDA